MNIIACGIRNGTLRKEEKHRCKKEEGIQSHCLGFGVNEKSYAIIMFWNNDTGAVPVLGVLLWCCGLHCGLHCELHYGSCLGLGFAALLPADQVGVGDAELRVFAVGAVSMSSSA